MARFDSNLDTISPDRIVRNPDNPRIVFREEDMQALLESIKEVGIKVPVSLYREGKHYVLIDGERRWRCAKRLNLVSVPAIVQPKPTKLENLLMMFNIHNVRVDWDPMPMAFKLREVRDLLGKEGKPTNPRELSAVTGVSVSSVRRAFDLLDLPDRYQKLLLKESEKPRPEQKIKADLFIEIYKSLHVIEKHSPEVLDSVSKDEYVDSMVEKYREGVIDNVVSFRQVSKIARSEKAGIEKKEAVPALVKLVRERKYSIPDAYGATVESAYQNRDMLTRIRGLTEKLEEIKGNRKTGNEFVEALKALRVQIDRLLG